MKTKITNYFARTKKEKEIDDALRTIFLSEGSKVEMALYLQNQMILNELRRIGKLKTV